MNPSLSSTRRHFLTSAGATVALAGFPGITSAQGDRKAPLKIGLVGCGGRGTGAASQALSADPDVKLWAVGDVFAPQAESALNHLSNFADRIEVPQERRFSGLEAYQQVIDSGVDMVLLASPPGFRPQHFRYAVEAGKHVFAEKPMAVDINGVKSVRESARMAKEKGVTVQHGYCWRFAPETRAGYGKVLAGELGAIVSVYGTYLGGVPKPSTSVGQRNNEWGDVEWQIRNWMGHEWLSGGPLLEQAVHTVDKIAWAMGDVAPIAARGSGGRTHRDDDGNVWDHYEVTFEYPHGVFCHIGQRQFPHGFSEVKDRVFCEKGTLEAPDRVIALDRSQKISWAFRGEARNMYQICHDEWFAAIRKGEPLNAGEYMANSTMLGILAREAAHTGERITWDQLWETDQDFASDSLKLGDHHPVREVPKPGIYKIA